MVEYLKDDGARGVPPVVVSGLTFAGVPVADWMCLVTIIYTLIISYIALYKFLHRGEKRQ